MRREKGRRGKEEKRKKYGKRKRRNEIEEEGGERAREWRRQRSEDGKRGRGM